MYNHDTELMLKYARELTYAELEKDAFWSPSAVTAGVHAGWQSLKDVGARALKAFQVGGVHTPVGAVAETIKTEPLAAINSAFQKTQKANAAAAKKKGDAAMRVLRNEGPNRFATARLQGRKSTLRNQLNPTVPTTVQKAKARAAKLQALKGQAFDFSAGKAVKQEPGFFDNQISNWKWKSGKPITYGDAAAGAGIGAAGIGAGAMLLSGGGNNEQKAASDSFYGSAALYAAARVSAGL